MSKFEEIIRQIYGTSSDPLPDYTDFGLQCMDRLYDMVMEIVEKELGDPLLDSCNPKVVLEGIKTKLEALKGEK